MRVTDINLQNMLKFLPGEGRLLLGEDRMLLFRQDAIAALRQIIYHHLGSSLARAVLSQFGYRCGSGDYAVLQAAYPWETEIDELSAGPALHMWEGIVHVEVTKLEFDRKLSTFHMMGLWRNSYEAEVHLAEFGPSATPVCHTLTGYATGWASAFFDHKMMAVETLCTGRGDPHCAFEIRKDSDWGPEANPWREALSSDALTLVREQDQLIARQEAAIRELSTPIVQVWSGVLTLAIVGALDTARADAITDGLLSKVVATRARFTILDLTAVELVDTTTANHVLRIVRAVQLLGADCVITGIRPAVAQSMVSTGIDLASIKTLATLENGLRYCIDRLGVRITEG